MNIEARRKASVLGATGHVGRAALEVVRDVGLEVDALSAGSDVEGLARLAREYGAKAAAIGDEGRWGDLKEALSGSGVEAWCGKEGVLRAAGGGAGRVVAATGGAAGLEGVLAALGVGAWVALANKESLVCGGGLVQDAERAGGGKVLPVDSEHHGLWRLLEGHGKEGLEKATLTASGGPFWDWGLEEMEKATPVQACAHPVWRMGRKISVDSATLMNKGLELLEASRLFGLSGKELGVLVHRQARVHAMAYYADGSLYAHCGRPDMKIPLGWALSWGGEGSWGGGGWGAGEVLGREGWTFEEQGMERFPALGLARAAMEEGGGAPVRLNGANEEAVGMFLDGEIGFGDVMRAVSRVMEKGILRGEPTSLEEAYAMNDEARREARDGALSGGGKV